MQKITLFSQIINKLNKNIFRRIINKHLSDKHSKGINSWTHLVSMLFCQFSKSNSLREISNGLKSATGNLNHMGIQKAPCKSSLSYINANRTWEIFQEYFYAQYEEFKAKAEFAKTKFRIRTKKILLLDSSLISLCLSVFDWAKYRRSKGAIKLHTLLDYDSCLPVYVHMTDGKKSDSVIAKEIPLPKDSLVVADRAYIDFDTLYKWHLSGNNFVIRLKTNIKFERLKEKKLPDGRDEHIIIDEYIQLTETATFNKYPKKLRRVVVYDAEHDRTIELITNQFNWTASTIGELYKQRWMIEIFFKEIKQHLKVKSFIGTSQNAVLIQIWTALITIMILKYLKQIAKYNWCLSNLIAFLRLNLFVKIDLQLWLDKPFEPIIDPVEDNYYQLYLF